MTAQTKDKAAVEPWPSGGIELHTRTLAEVEVWLTQPGYVIPWPDMDPSDASAQINAGILAGEDPLQADGDDASKLEDVEGLSWRILSVDFRPSDASSGADPGGAYAIIKGATADGEAVVLITGSEKVLARCVALVKRNGLGRWVKVVRGAKETRQGRVFFDLVAGNEPFPAA
jgi:hypothetical protein